MSPLTKLKRRVRIKETAKAINPDELLVLNQPLHVTLEVYFTRVVQGGSGRRG